jgi:hypothetical protein
MLILKIIIALLAIVGLFLICAPTGHEWFD